MPRQLDNAAPAQGFLRAVEHTLRVSLPEGTRLIAAVSGGADSVALAWALDHLAHHWPLTRVVFIDHGLRDVSAERDAAEAAARGRKFTVQPVSVGPGNLQAAARRARYEALLALAREDDAFIATGHTASDQAETVLARMLRGSGVPGLAGLAVRRGRVVRPLLGVSRRQTRALGLPFVDDPSNATPRFQRNRIRALLERLGREQPHVEQALCQLADAARASTRLLDAVALAVPDVSFAGRDREATEALLVHRVRVAGGSSERRALRDWAAALTRGGLDAVSLGDGLRGVATHGRACVAIEEDPRRTVVAWHPGTYRARAMELTITEAIDGSSSTESGTLVPAHEVAWPLKLRPARRSERGALGTTIDLESGDALGGWRVEDASGRTLVPASAPLAARSRVADGVALLRIELKRCA